MQPLQSRPHAPMHTQAPVQQQPSAGQQLATTAPAESKRGWWQSGSFSFSDVIDMINPLQHLPIISTIYRKLTHDEMGDAARVVGDTLFGGLTGNWISSLATSLANAFVSQGTGKDIGEHLVASVESLTAGSASVAAAQASPQAAPRSVPEVSPQAVPPIMVTRASQASMSDPVPAPVPETAVSVSRLDRATGIAPEQATVGQLAMSRYQQQIVIDRISDNTDYWV